MTPTPYRSPPPLASEIRLILPFSLIRSADYHKKRQEQLNSNSLFSSQRHQQREKGRRDLLVDPVVNLDGVVVVDLLGLEPVSNLAVGRVDGIRTVADVAPGLDGEVSADGAGSRGQGVGGSEQDASLLDDIESLPDHGDHGAGAHVVDEGREEGLVLQVLVVDLEGGGI